MHDETQTHDSLTDATVSDLSRQERVVVPPSVEPRASIGEQQAQAPRMPPILRPSALSRVHGASGAPTQQAPRDFPPPQPPSYAPASGEAALQSSPPTSPPDEPKRRQSFEEMIANFKAVQQTRLQMEADIERRFGAPERKAVWNAICAMCKSDAQARQLVAAHSEKLEESDAKLMRRLLAYWGSCYGG